MPPLVKHAFDVDPDDHCETPPEAYDDISDALRWLATTLGKPTAADLKIYDPYFCAGAVKRNLGSRGFPNVYNENEDFYAVAAAGKQPDYDVLVTNPPYSDNHIEKVLQFCVGSKKPWFLLVPNYVYVNPYYDPIMAAAEVKPFFVVPRYRYQYWAPGGVRSDREQKTSPFLSFWYCDLNSRSQPGLTAAFIKQRRLADAKQAEAKEGAAEAEAAAPTGKGKGKKGKKGKEKKEHPPALLAGHRSQLPHNMRAQYDPTRRRLVHNRPSTRAPPYRSPFQPQLLC